MLLTADTIQKSITIDGYIVGFIGTVISIMLVIIGFFLKILISEIRETRDSVISLTVNYTNQDKRCSSAHSVIDTRLNKHSEMINKHETAIELLKQQI